MFQTPVSHVTKTYLVSRTYVHLPPCNQKDIASSLVFKSHVTRISRDQHTVNTKSSTNIPHLSPADLCEIPAVVVFCNEIQHMASLSCLITYANINGWFEGQNGQSSLVNKIFVFSEYFSSRKMCLPTLPRICRQKSTFAKVVPEDMYWHMRRRWRWIGLLLRKDVASITKVAVQCNDARQKKN